MSSSFIAKRLVLAAFGLAPLLPVVGCAVTSPREDLAHEAAGTEDGSGDAGVQRFDLEIDGFAMPSDGASERASTNKTGSTCYFFDDLDAFVDSGGTWRGHRVYSAEMDDGRQVLCAASWEFDFPGSGGGGGGPIRHPPLSPDQEPEQPGPRIP